ncbi:ABC transporter permease [Metabacillus malikii]|uniref:ABC-2 type transport system permease protein n=1 Tax=Metabacillus malikii TaxID=1504265 RepID=A0ABT9ZAL8_9BACI|nr:ABC transporter permease [Metabacillus malikii]MDQ0229289.1 ABC-2 type transport system permease protein [Metabacillus malikii]
MKNVIVFTGFQLNILWKNRKSAILLWLSPIFFFCLLLFIGMSVINDERRVDTFQIAIVNDDPTLETKLVIQQLTENEDFNQIIHTLQIDEKQAYELLEKNEIAAIIYIPKGFSMDVTQGINTPVQVVGNKHQPLQAQMIRYVMESAAKYTSAAQSGINTVNDFMKEVDRAEEDRSDIVKRAIISYSLHVLGRNDVFSETEQQNLYQESMVEYYLVSFTVLLVMIWSFIGILLMNKQMNHSVKQRLLSLGVSSFQRLVSTFLATSFIVVVSMILIIIPLNMLGEEQLVFNASLLCAMISIPLLFTAIFSLLQSIFDQERTFQLFGIGVILFGALTGGHFIPIIFYPEWLQHISQWVINTWVLKHIITMFEGDPLFDPSSYLLCLAITIILLLVSKIILYIRSKVKVGEG